jgi:hypothetical protein
LVFLGKAVLLLWHQTAECWLEKEGKKGEKWSERAAVALPATGLLLFYFWN